jgi:hypothetical protein
VSSTVISIIIYDTTVKIIIIILNA